MTATELKAWRDRLGLTNREAAAELALTYAAFLAILYGRRKVTPQTARIAELVEDQTCKNAREPS